MICEYCKEEHDGEYGSGRFCNSKCARGFSTKAKRKDINKNLSEKMKGYKTIPGGMIKLCDYGCGKEAKFEMTNGNWCCENHYSKCPSIIKKNSIALKSAYKSGRKSKFIMPQEALDRSLETRKNNLCEYYNSIPFEKKPDAERRRIILNEQDEKCLICGIKDWNNKSLVLHLDHIDGNNQNNKRENLRIICPNCHSQTDTYCRGKPKNISDKKLSKLLIKNNFNFCKTLNEVDLVPGGYNWERITKLANKIMPA
jgi:5-methylcytosine-specific restriction endonuclease McrA